MVAGELPEKVSFLDEYDIEGVLGGGRFSTVLRAKSRATNKVVAVKVVRKPTRHPHPSPSSSGGQSDIRVDDGDLFPLVTPLSSTFEASPNSSAIANHRRDPSGSLPLTPYGPSSSSFLPPPSSALPQQASSNAALPATRLKRIRTEYFVLLQQLRECHPLLVEVDRIGHTTNFLFFVMKQYEASLSTLLRDPNSVRNLTLSEDQARFVCVEVLTALEYLHYKGIVYRDLKPENILLGRDFHVALSDFDLSHAPAAHDDLQGDDAASTFGDHHEVRRGSGPVSLAAAAPAALHQTNALSGSSKLSSCSSGGRSNSSNLSGAPPAHNETPLSSPHKIFKPLKSLPTLAQPPSMPPNTGSTHQRTTSFVGTLEYLSPEVLRDAPVTPAIDFWCLGMLLYEMLFGFTAFRGNNERDIRFKQDEYFSIGADAKLTFPISPSVSDEAKDLLQKLLCPSTKHRATAAVIREHAWVKRPHQPAGLIATSATSIRDVHRRRSPLASLLSLTHGNDNRREDELSQVSKSFEKYMRKPPRPRPQNVDATAKAAADATSIQKQQRDADELSAVKRMLLSENIQYDCAADEGLSFFVPVVAAGEQQHRGERNHSSFGEAPPREHRDPMHFSAAASVDERHAAMEEKFRHVFVSSSRLQFAVSEGNRGVGADKPLQSKQRKQSLLSRLFSSSSAK